ncbi:glycosyltransferase family 17-domain-containing protein [Haematococcus lacustris]
MLVLMLQRGALLLLLATCALTCVWCKPPCPAFTLKGRPPTPDHSSDPSWCSTRQLTYGDGTSPSLSPRAKQRRIIDTFTFNDEFDMLDIRLHTLWDVVDTFVIVESNTTFTGKPKQLHFLENQGRYTEFMSKIHHYVMVYPQEMPPGQWERERAARKAQFSLEQSLKGVALTTDDLIVMADLDELMDPSMLETLKWCDGANLEYFCFNTHFSLYSYEYVSVNMPSWEHPNGFRYQEGVPGPEPVHFRGNKAAHGCFRNGGWHCSSCFDKLEQFQSKLTSYSHTEYNTPKNRHPATLLYRITNGLDMAGGELMQWRRAEPANMTAPPIVLDNPQCYTFLINRRQWLVDLAHSMAQHAPNTTRHL